MQEGVPDLYELLDVDPWASQSRVEEQFRRKRQTALDKAQSTEELETAFAILSKQASREEYDALIHKNEAVQRTPSRQEIDVLFDKFSAGHNPSQDAQITSSIGPPVGGVRRSWYGNKWVLLVLGVVSVIVVLLAWLVLTMFSAKGDAQAVVEAFLEAASAGRTEVAIGHISSQALFQDELAESIRFGAWIGYEDISVDGFELTKATDGTYFYLEGSVLHTDGDRSPFEVTLIKEGDQWKILDMSFG